jgi:hypothetical protein
MSLETSNVFIVALRSDISHATLAGDNASLISSNGFVVTIVPDSFVS